MASKREVVDTIFQPMLDLYNPPDGMVGEKRLLAVRDQYIKALTPYSKRTLERAWERVRATHYGWTWPTLQEIITECNKCS